MPLWPALKFILHRAPAIVPPRPLLSSVGRVAPKATFKERTSKKENSPASNRLAFLALSLRVLRAERQRAAAVTGTDFKVHFGLRFTKFFAWNYPWDPSRRKRASDLRDLTNRRSQTILCRSRARTKGVPIKILNLRNG